MSRFPGIRQLLPVPAHMDLVVVPPGEPVQTVVALALLVDPDGETGIQAVVLRNGALVVSVDDVWEREASDA